MYEMKTMRERKPVSPGNQESNSGIYHLLVHLSAPKRVRIGKLGVKTFPSGYYIYTGSARRNLTKRFERHLKNNKKLHWHIDYLTVVAAIDQILVHLSKSATECERANAIIKLAGAEIIVPRFGSSDCNCRTHLVYFQTKPCIY